MTDLPEILVIGGTGAQGTSVVQSLASSNRYRVRILTRDPSSSGAKYLASLPNVTLIEGQVDNEQDFRVAFSGVYGAWVNTDGFTLGEKNEFFYGIRTYEIARHKRIKHFVWSNIDYALRKSSWDKKYYCGHINAKGRIGDDLKSTLFSTGPYMNMLFDGLFVPKEDPDGTVVWANPADYFIGIRPSYFFILATIISPELFFKRILDSGKIPLIALEDIGSYALWVFDHPDRSAGLDLELATEEVSFQQIAETFTRVTGRPAIHRRLPVDQYMDAAEPYPNAPINFTVASTDTRDASVMTWRENFTAWWLFWSNGLGATRNFDLLDEINPTRIKSLEEWMRMVNYDGKPRNVLKGLEDFRVKRSQ